MNDDTPKHLIPGRRPNYDLTPVVNAGSGDEVAVGFDEVAARIGDHRRVVVETYPGVRPEDVRELARRLGADEVVDAVDALRPPQEIDALVEPWLGDHPVFGYLTRLELVELFDPARLGELRDRVSDHPGRVVVIGCGASLVCDEGVLVYAGMPRWEAQQRQRRGEVPNLGADNAGTRASLLYKRSFFCDWRICDRYRRTLWDRIDHVLDTTTSTPKLISAPTYLRALRDVTRRPFRVVPFFDPAPWGGRWIQEVVGVGRDEPNIGWCFDCVPEENSLLLGFGDETVEVPSVDVVFREPEALLGDAVYGRFGAEFPIRFDFLDTIGGGNLSLQVHPLTGYIQERFGVPYTQDESYYILDAVPGEASVYLGVKDDVDREGMLRDLRRAQDEPGWSFPAEEYVNRFPVSRHDHVLIPAGTVHCSGAGAMVLEISATPYIFTFKLWDWDRLGLDGRPRPISLDHGERNIRWDRDTSYAKSRLMHQTEEVARGEGWTEERTGLHEAEFIETRRHWFRAPVPHDAAGAVNVLNLVEGEAAVVESPDGAFAPYTVHYAETFIVPAAAGPYTIRPAEPGARCATIKASVRTNP